MEEAASDHGNKGDEVLHFKTQAGQPYGSESRKCSKCGVRLWGDGDGVWTDELLIWEEPPPGFRNCSSTPRFEKRKWTLSDAVFFLRTLSEEAKKAGYGVGLTGSVLLSGQSLKDLDVILYPLRTGEESEAGLKKALAMAGMRCLYDSDAIREIWRRKGSSDAKRVECWMLGGKRVDIFLLK